MFICSWRQVNVGLLWIFHLPKELDGLFIQRWTNWPIDLFCIYWKWHFNWPCGKDKFLLGFHWIKTVSTCYSWEWHHIEGGSTAFNKSGGFCTAMNTNWITVVFGGGTKVIVTGKFWFLIDKCKGLFSYFLWTYVSMYLHLHFSKTFRFFVVFFLRVQGLETVA